MKRATDKPQFCRDRGFTYLGLLFAVAVLGVGLAGTGVVWHTAKQREKERELLFVGNQFRRAIEQYYLATPGALKKYPLQIEDMLRDPRLPSVQRYLRRVYADPLTGRSEWGLVRAPDGGIMGVYSLSDAMPVKVALFRTADRNFEGKERYSDWKFIARSRPFSGGGGLVPGVLDGHDGVNQSPAVVR